MMIAYDLFSLELEFKHESKSTGGCCSWRRQAGTLTGGCRSSFDKQSHAPSSTKRLSAIIRLPVCAYESHFTSIVCAYCGCLAVVRMRFSRGIQHLRTAALASINRPSCYLTHRASIRDILSSLPRCLLLVLLLLLQLPFLPLRFVHVAAKSMNGIRWMEARLLCPVGLFVSYVAVKVFIRATDLVRALVLDGANKRLTVVMGVPKGATLARTRDFDI